MFLGSCFSTVLDLDHCLLCSLQDAGNLSDTTTVIITVEDFDNFNPYFDHALYWASIPENTVRLHFYFFMLAKGYSSFT